MAEDEGRYLLWAEKYRPRSLDEIVNQEESVARLKRFLKEKNAPHMLFAGPPGTGKTTTALAFAHDLYGESYHQYILELNASVTGDTPITVRTRHGVFQTSFKELEKMGSSIGGVEVLTVDNNLKPLWMRATRLIKHMAPAYLQVTLEDGSILNLTGNHSVMVFQQSGLEAVRASEIRPGTKLLKLDSSPNDKPGKASLLKVKKIEMILEEKPVYDISVPGNQMFFAGETPVLLHNSDERGIDVIRTKIKEFARSRVAGEIPFKLIILDESDNMCLEPNTKVMLGDPVKGDLYQRTLSEILDEYDEKPFKLPSLDTGNLRVIADEGRIVRSGKARLYEIGLEDGRKIMASPNHPFFRINGFGEVKVVRTRELRPGGLIADLRQYGFENNGEANPESQASVVPHARIAYIKHIGIRDVLNITVKRNKNFILGNGILTHNTSDAQQALRRLMENFTATSRFILIANYPSKIIEPIQSRTAVFRFTPLKKEQVVSRLAWIAEREKVDYDEKALEAIYEISEGDMRKAINILQAASALGKVTVDSVYKVVGLAHPKEIREMISHALKGEFEAARKKLRELMVNYGLSGVDIIKQVHREIFGNELELSEDLRVLIADYSGEIQFRLVEGADDEIQLNAFLAWLTLLGKRVGL